MRYRTPQPGDLCERVRRSPLATVVRRFSDYLDRLGYSPNTVHQYLSAAEHFGRWLKHRKISYRLVHRFVSRHLPACGCKLHVMCNINCVRAAMNRLLEMLKIEHPTLCERFRVHSYSKQLLVEYERHLRDVRGMAASTIRFRLHNAAAMLTRFGVRSGRDLRGVTPSHVSGFMTARLRGRTQAGAAPVASATRLFLRFLLMSGHLTRDMTGVVLSPPQWRLTGLPTTVTDSELAKLVATCDGQVGLASVVDLRDRAILLCLIDLGMRSSDVAALRAGGVDLAADTLTLHQPKRRSGSVLPMTPRLSQAMRAYLPLRLSAARNAQPHIDCLFVKHRAPTGQALRAGGIRGVVRRRAHLAGLQNQVTGPHIIRHSFASALLRRGASMKQIADLLGHRSIDTTSIYAKVDIHALSAVAMPWPASTDSSAGEVAQ